ncbi:MAG: 4-hydroxybutyrate CoA-transferase, partial [Muribaculaceae bacterium]|nr:4-hydroxybutyrate CoA-transferase [Muribaculaceae bacterium]
MDQKVNYMTAAEAIRLIESGDHVYVQGSTSIPEILLDALAERALKEGDLKDITVYSAFAVGRRPSPLCQPALK